MSLKRSRRLYMKDYDMTNGKFHRRSEFELLLCNLFSFVDLICLTFHVQI